MSFFNNPENNSVKVLLIIILIAIAGLFVFDYMHTNALENAGRVVTKTTGNKGNGCNVPGCAGYSTTGGNGN